MLRLLGVLSVSLLLVGCHAKSVCGEDEITFEAPPQGPPLSGQPVSLALHLDSSSACLKASDVKLTATLHDPDGAEVPVQITPHTTDDGDQVRVDATLDFTAGGGGNYHLEGQLDPGAIPFTQDLMVIAGAEGAAQVQATLPRACATLARTQKGGLLCDGVLFRDGNQEQTLSGQVAVAGDSVWSYANGTLRAFTDPGTGPLTAVGTAPASDGGPSLLVAGPKDAYVIWDNQAQHFVATDAGVVAAGAASVTFGPDAGAARAAAYGQGFALLATDAPDAGSYVCEVDATDTSVVAAPCLTSTHALLGGDARGIWLADAAKITTQRSPPTQEDGLANLYWVTGSDSGPTLGGSLIFPDGLAATHQGGAAWVESGLYGLTLVPAFGSQNLYLQQLSPGTQEPVVGVSDALFWTQPPGFSRTAVFNRP